MNDTTWSQKDKSKEPAESINNEAKYNNTNNINNNILNTLNATLSNLGNFEPSPTLVTIANPIKQKPVTSSPLVQTLLITEINMPQEKPIQTSNIPNKNSKSTQTKSTILIEETAEPTLSKNGPVKSQLYYGNQFGESAVRGQDYLQFLMIIIGGLCATSISQSSNFYMLYRIVGRNGWYNSWNQRFPFYLAAQDTFLSLNMLTEWIEILSTQHFPSRLVCQLQGGFLNFAIAWNVMLVTCTALTAYIKIYEERQVNFGRWDWKFHFVCLIVPSVGVGVGVLSHAFGTSTYWCQINVASLSGRINMLCLCGLITLGTFITGYCYFKVIAKIQASFTNLQSMRNSTKPFLRSTLPSPNFQNNQQASGSIYSLEMTKNPAENKQKSLLLNKWNMRKVKEEQGHLKRTSDGALEGFISNIQEKEGRVHGWEDEAIDKMSSYIFVFSQNFLEIRGPSVLAYILIFNGYDNIVSNTIMVLFVHLGGFFNAIVYLRQHGYFSPR
ncbi:hypothetical protein G9A89_005393 [Geosiphon pyriformis]|nr:hypothetical protein G9A89_005393 [Geosiphon pyriformis]